MERAGAPAGSQIRLEPFQEPAGGPATPQARLAQRASARVGRKPVGGAVMNDPKSMCAPPTGCRPIQPLPTPRSLRNALLVEPVRELGGAALGLRREGLARPAHVHDADQAHL